MKTISSILLLLIALTMGNNDTVYQFTVDSIDGEQVSLNQYEGKVLLIVNVASKCGYTPQYEGLEKLYETYKDDGLEILGFPANNFMGQEPGSDEEIMQFCRATYGVSFPMFSKISVKGNDQAPLYEFLTDKEKNGVVDGKVKWNFQKYLVGKDGRVIAMFEPGVEPLSEELTAAIQEALAK